MTNYKSDEKNFTSIIIIIISCQLSYGYFKTITISIIRITKNIEMNYISCTCGFINN